MRSVTAQQSWLSLVLKHKTNFVTEKDNLFFCVLYSSKRVVAAENEQISTNKSHLCKHGSKICSDFLFIVHSLGYGLPSASNFRNSTSFRSNDKHRKKKHLVLHYIYSNNLISKSVCFDQIIFNLDHFM